MNIAFLIGISQLGKASYARHEHLLISWHYISLILEEESAWANFS